MTASNNTTFGKGELPTMVGLTMSSLEIAGLTGKGHFHVLRDTRKMLEALGISASKFGCSYRGEDGKDHTLFNLPKRETLILVSGYSVEMRARIIDRWMQLEAAIGGGEAEIGNLSAEVRRVIGGIVKGVVHSEISSVLPTMVESALTADERAVATEYKPSLQVLLDRKVPAKKRRSFSQKVSRRLLRFSTEREFKVRISRETKRYLFHVDAIASWLCAEGEQMIADHMAVLCGQGVLKLVRPSPLRSA